MYSGNKGTNKEMARVKVVLTDGGYRGELIKNIKKEFRISE